MSVKRTWPISVGNTGRRLSHIYSGNVLVNARYEAYLSGVVQDGPEKGRDVSCSMTAQQAIDLGHRLIALGERVNQANEEAGTV